MPVTSCVTETRVNTISYVELTRVYKSNLDGQPIMVATDEVATVRPSNALGYPDHRSTITLKNGQAIHLAQKYSEVKEILGIN